jgi:hypothetical protein
VVGEIQIRECALCVIKKKVEDVRKPEVGERSL